MAKKRIAPIHPGAYLKELLVELDISQNDLAKSIGMPPTCVGQLVRAKRPVTAELALRLGRYFGQSPRYWLNLQSRFDMDSAEEKLGRRVEREVRPFKAVA